MLSATVSDKLYKYFSAAISASAIVFLIVIAIVLVIYSYPSIVVYGIKFFTTTVWNPALDQQPTMVHGFEVLRGSSFGVLVPLVGTILSSALALIFGVPLSLGIAIFLTQYSPRRLSYLISFVIETMAGIPSVIYGFWGFLVLGPFLLNYLEPLMAKYLSFLPFFKGPVYSYGFLASGMVLAIMIVPIITSISRDALMQTPQELKDAGRAMGLTSWEIVRKIMFPFAKSSIIGAVILGLGRALGETMAVAMVSGTATSLPVSIYSPINSMAAFMALSLDGAQVDPTKMFIYALVEMAALLLIITMIVNVVARILVRHGFITSESFVQV